MKLYHLAGATTGALVGLILATVFRPSIPLLGQLPIIDAFSTIGSDDSLDAMYGAAFAQTLAIGVALGVLAGLMLAIFAKGKRGEA